jgi:ferredoxin
VLLADPPPAEEDEAVRSAAHACPARVISVE